MDNEYAKLRTRAQLEELAPQMGLPYTADTMRAPMRELGMGPYETKSLPGTKTSRLAYYDPIVLWVLLLSFNTPRSWRKRTASESPVKPAAPLGSLLEGYRTEVEQIELPLLFDAGMLSEEPRHVWDRVAIWRLLVDPRHGLDLRLLDRTVADFPESVELDASGFSVLGGLLQRYKEAMLASLGTKLGGSDGASYDAWDLIVEVLESRRDEIGLAFTTPGEEVQQGVDVKL